MTQPTVACIMLANGRPEMVARAVKSFRAQTYKRKSLFVLNTGPSPQLMETLHIKEPCFIGADAWTIGRLRNEANESCVDADILLHWDSDDWSHPNRIAEQVALLQSSGAECVGYHEMLFWDSTPGQFCGAWLYRASITNYAIGTSMCYWRETWEKHPFPDRSEGCDDLYWYNKGVKIESDSSGPAKPECMIPKPVGYGRVELIDPLKAFRDNPALDLSPRMIASIHGGNTCAKIDAKAREWTRVPEWDSYAREAMKL